MVQEQLEKSQAKYKVRHDKNRVDHSFEVGDECGFTSARRGLKEKVKS
jgi:hypothetical protein